MFDQDVRSRADLHVLVRDDGSKDATLDLLEAYEGQGKLQLVRGRNEGAVPSFLDALAQVPDRADYVALCDQDDVWHPDKLSRALDKLQDRSPDQPLLYCSEYLFCDADMVPVEPSHHNVRGLDFSLLLYENMASGNTMLFNRRLLDMAKAAGKQDVYQHDWWLALTAAAFGTIVFDDFICLDYRRTGRNASPTGAKGLALCRQRVRMFLRGGQLRDITRQLQRFHALYADRLDPEKRAVLERFLEKGRMAKAFYPHRLRQLTKDELPLRLLFLLGLL